MNIQLDENRSGQFNSSCVLKYTLETLQSAVLLIISMAVVFSMWVGARIWKRPIRTLINRLFQD